ncbi:MAG: M1 family peptidase, partial [Bacteroidia bacterium]|nr:M1 family peptidase [Bacteroidia bacterium]
SLFLAAMQNYFEQWKFAHPYMEDFRNSVIQFTHVDLNWFFDEWIETSKTIDYSVKSVKKGKEKGQYKITFKRHGMQMPIDFTVIAKNDSLYHYHIPNTWFVKQTKATVLPRWIGWDKVKHEYTAIVTVPSGVADVIIDSSTRLADVNMLNNNKKFPLKYRFDSKIYNPSDWTRYELFARPDVWYNGYDGIKAGLNMNGHYMNYKHIFDATVWFNTGIGQNYLDSTVRKDLYDNISFRFLYKTSTDKFMKGSSFNFSAKALDGLNAYTIGFDRKDIKGKNKLYMFFKSMYRKGLNDLPYLLLPKEWTPNMLNNTLNVGIEHTYSYKRGTGNIHLGMRSSALMSDYDFQTIHLNAVNRNRLGRFVLNTRVFAQYGTGTNWANESSLFLAGANPEEMMDNKYTRSQGIFDPSWASIGATTNNFQHGGGLNIRGYSGYLAPERQSDGTLAFAYKGQTGAAFNMELEFDGLIRVRRQNWLTKTFKLNTYLFADAGVLNYNVVADKTLKMADLRADAGLGVALTIKKFGVLQTVNPLTLRFDMPFFLNKIPASDKGFIQYRFVFGVSRAF